MLLPIKSFCHQQLTGMPDVNRTKHEIFNYSDMTDKTTKCYYYYYDYYYEHTSHNAYTGINIAPRFITPVLLGHTPDHLRCQLASGWHQGGLGDLATTITTTTTNNRLTALYYAPARRVGGIKRCFCPSVCPSVCRVHSE